MKPFFVTRIEQRLSDGKVRIFHSRAHRKGLAAIEFARDGNVISVSPEHNAWFRFWAPDHLSWWIALLFIIGSGCFSVAGFASNWPQFFPLSMVKNSNVNTLFFIGSLFFTAAAGMQLLEAINGDITDINALVRKPTAWRWFAWKPRNAGYSSSLIQFIGTLLFNLNTADAMLQGLSWTQEDVLVWIPDFIGSICFLCSSYIAIIEVSHSLFSVQPYKLEWWIAILNLLGSITFMLSASYSIFMPNATGIVWAWGANFFTFTGAVCFFFASYLMIPELFGAGRSINKSF